MKHTILFVLIASLAIPTLAQTPPRASDATRLIPSPTVERRCPTVIVYERGIADNFGGGPDPVYRSLALDAFLANAQIPGHPNALYDENTECDRHFGDSFKVDSCVFCCGICSATLEITLRGCGSALDCNDSITVGQAPFGAGGQGYVLWNGYVNGTGCPGGPGPIGPNDPIPVESGRTPNVAAKAPSSPSQTIVKSIPLDPRRLAELVCERKAQWIDVYIQDDQIVDSMRLIITKP